MILQHALILQVILPLLSAPVCAVFSHGRMAWGFATLVTWCAFGLSLLLMTEVQESGVVSYALGNWLPPFGIEYRLDRLSAFMLVLVSGIGAVSMPYALKSVGKEITADKQPLFYTVYLLCFAGLLGMIVTHDAFNVFVFLEISSLATYTLIAMGKSRQSLVAAFEYLILGTIGATFYLIGVGLLYMKTGTLNMGDLHVRIALLSASPAIKAALAFITLGLALKFALFPLHLWLCNGYTHAPSFISAFLAGTATKVSLYVLIRMLVSVFGLDFAFDALPLGMILGTLGFFAVLVGSGVALSEGSVKRMLAYSSVAQIGYIVLALSLATSAGLSTALVHIINHGLAKAALFLAAGCVFYRTGSARLDDFKGLGRHMPYTMAAFVAVGLSLVGVPLTAGFISKWYLVNALIAEGRWLLLGAVLVSSVLAVGYIWRVIEAAYFKERAVAVKEAPLTLLVPCWTLVLANIVFGVYSAPVTGMAERVVEQLTQMTFTQRENPLCNGCDEYPLSPRERAFPGVRQ